MLELEMEKEQRNESKGNEAEFPPSDVNPCVLCTFLSVAYLSACLISSLGSRLTPKVSMNSHQDTLHQTMDNPKSQIRSKTLVKR